MSNIILPELILRNLNPGQALALSKPPCPGMQAVVEDGDVEVRGGLIICQVSLLCAGADQTLGQGQGLRGSLARDVGILPSKSGEANGQENGQRMETGALIGVPYLTICQRVMNEWKTTWKLP